MAQVQKKAAGAPESKCKVKHGIQTIELKLGDGKSVQQVFDTFKKAMNLSADMAVYIHQTGKESLAVAAGDLATTQVPEGATVEFIKAAGQKGKIGR
jgi:hypothetical protein